LLEHVPPTPCRYATSPFQGPQPPGNVLPRPPKAVARGKIGVQRPWRTKKQVTRGKLGRFCPWETSGYNLCLLTRATSLVCAAAAPFFAGLYIVFPMGI